MQKHSKKFSQLSPKLSIDPMLISNTNINVPVAQLLSPKLSLYDFHSSSCIIALSDKMGESKKGCGDPKKLEKGPKSFIIV